MGWSRLGRWRVSSYHQGWQVFIGYVEAVLPAIGLFKGVCEGCCRSKTLLRVFRQGCLNNRFNFIGDIWKLLAQWRWWRKHVLASNLGEGAAKRKVAR